MKAILREARGEAARALGAGPSLKSLRHAHVQSLRARSRSNQALDSCDIDAGTSEDCDVNGVPDDCEIGAGDCNLNGVPDSCDVAAGAQDCQGAGNGVPDVCGSGG